MIHPMAGAKADGDSMRLPLLLEPYEAKLIVIGASPDQVFAPEPSLLSGNTLTALDGDWTVDLNGQHLTTPLKSWQDLGAPAFAGPAIYRKRFTAPAVPAGKHVYLEISDVRDYARVRVNGAVFEAQAWQPYRWDITASLQPGSNDLEINVYASPAGRGGSAGASAAAPAAAGGRAGQVGPPGSATALNAPGGAARAELRARGVFSPPVSGLLGPVRLVAR
jgi:hypothetical protein